jgi:hypothetical protein
MFNLRSLWSGRRTTTKRKDTPPTSLLFRPQVEGFEDRTVPSAPANLGPALVAPAAASSASLLPINITSVAFNPVTGVITAVGTIGNQAFTATGLLTLTQPSAGSTPILHLELNEIHLDLLGLKVDTSEICLDITAQSGSGNLLGNLLTDIAHLLDGGTPIGSILGGLSPTQLGTLTSGLNDVLNGVFGQLGSPANVTGANSITNILHLSLGPVDLNILGLNVSLDDCHNGPVTVDISAESGPGKLLGNLLTSVAHLLDGPANANALTNALNRVAGAINNLLR